MINFVLENKFENEFDKLHHGAKTFYSAVKVLDNNTMGFNAQQITKKGDHINVINMIC
jgi:hypothetical protein